MSVLRLPSAHMCRPPQLQLRRLCATSTALAPLAALERAPCLQCGAAKPLESPAEATCAVSGLRLACSPRCADSLASERRELLLRFRSIADDTAFSATDNAKLLFAQVLAAKRPSVTSTPRAAASAASWREFLQLYTSDERWLADPRALRLVSAAYSYVMTLSHFLPELRPVSGAAAEGGTDASIHVIGARAEATMPRHFWDELPFFHPDVSAFAITLIGDHVPGVRRSKAKRSAGEQQTRAVRLENITGLYHEPHVEERTRASPPHALVLFNPGIGHPFLKERWRPTITSLLASGKPILLTSFSHADQERDVAVLEELGEIAFRVPPQSNPFRSLKYQVDPLDLLTPIQTNSRVMVVQKVQ